MHTREDIEKLAKDFEKCGKTLLALGDENRQHLILEMMKMGNCTGARVLDITERTHLSRPVVSRHIKILKEAGILKVRREGTKNYYYFDPNQSSLELLTETLSKAKEIASELPDRSAEDN